MKFARTTFIYAWSRLDHYNWESVKVMLAALLMAIFYRRLGRRFLRTKCQSSEKYMSLKFLFANGSKVCDKCHQRVLEMSMCKWHLRTDKFTRNNPISTLNKMRTCLSIYLLQYLYSFPSRVCTVWTVATQDVGSFWRDLYFSI